MSLENILVATDYSPLGERAVEFASRLARDTGATLHIAHVCETEQYPVGESCPEEPEPNPEEMAKLRAVKPTEPGVDCEHHLLYGEPGSAEVPHPAESITRFARENPVDMIVVGTHGRSGLRHLLVGSVAEGLIRHAPCPVVTVRPREGE